jgi:flagellar biosynthesis/type III secretory pathway M-ring protein FliF/YscJ
MDFLSKYMAQIRGYLAGLTVSQKILIGLLVVIRLGTTFVGVSFSGKPEMVELLPQSLSAEEISTITS